MPERMPMPDTTTALTIPLMSPVAEQREAQVLHTPVVLRFLEWTQNLGVTDEGHALRVMTLIRPEIRTQFTAEKKSVPVPVNRALEAKLDRLMMSVLTRPQHSSLE